MKLCDLRRFFWHFKPLRQFMVLRQWSKFRKQGGDLSKKYFYQSLIAQSLFENGYYLEALPNNLRGPLAELYQNFDEKSSFIDYNVFRSYDLSPYYEQLKNLLLQLSSTPVFDALGEFYDSSFHFDKIQIIKTRHSSIPCDSELWHYDNNDSKSIHLVFNLKSNHNSFSVIPVEQSRSVPPDRFYVKRHQDNYIFNKISPSSVVKVQGATDSVLIFNPSSCLHKLNSLHSSDFYLFITFCSAKPYYPPSLDLGDLFAYLKAHTFTECRRFYYLLSKFPW